jgi:hypothetical protein
MVEEIDVGRFMVPGEFDDEKTNVIIARPIRKLIVNIDLSIHQRSTKKCTTIIEGIPDDIDLNKVLRAWKKVNIILLLDVQLQWFSQDT